MSEIVAFPFENVKAHRRLALYLSAHLDCDDGAGGEQLIFDFLPFPAVRSWTGLVGAVYFASTRSDLQSVSYYGGRHFEAREYALEIIREDRARFLVRAEVQYEDDAGSSCRARFEGWVPFAGFVVRESSLDRHVRTIAQADAVLRRFVDLDALVPTQGDPVVYVPCVTTKPPREVP